MFLLMTILFAAALAGSQKSTAPAFSNCERTAAVKCLDKCRVQCNNGVGNGPDCRPGRARFNNDDVGGVPGNPGAKGGGAQGTEYTTSEKGNNLVVNPDLVFQGDLDGTFKRTVCQDRCEDAEILSCRYTCCDRQVAKQCKQTCKQKCNNGVGNGPDCRPGRARFNNDDVGGVPGNPGARGGGAAGTEYVTQNKGDNEVVNSELEFLGDTQGTFHRTVCQDECEANGIKECRIKGEADKAGQCFTECKAKCNNGVGNGPDCRPGRARFNNDDVGGIPGAPGARGGGAAGTEYTTSEKGNNQVVNPDLVFLGELSGTFHKTRCQDKCEDDKIPRSSCPSFPDAPVPPPAPWPPSPPKKSGDGNPPPAESPQPPPVVPNPPVAPVPPAPPAPPVSPPVESPQPPPVVQNPPVAPPPPNTPTEVPPGEGGARLSNDSSGGLSTGAIVGIAVGAAVAAGVAALVIGFLVSRSSAITPAASHGAPMSNLQQNPIYQPLVSGGTNSLY